MHMMAPTFKRNAFALDCSAEGYHGVKLLDSMGILLERNRTSMKCRYSAVQGTLRRRYPPPGTSVECRALLGGH